MEKFSEVLNCEVDPKFAETFEKHEWAEVGPCSGEEVRLRDRAVPAPFPVFRGVVATVSPYGA